jgi:hypothetical protein
MRVAIHQPNFLPWLGFFHKANEADLLVLLDNVLFIKRGFIQRNYIKTNQGTQLIGVPIKTKGRYLQTIAETVIDNETPWQAKLIRTLGVNYAKAPAHAVVTPEIDAILARPYERLIDLNMELLRTAFHHLAITTPTLLASELTGIKGQGTERLISICHTVGADEYLSGAGGKNYQDESAFEAAGIRLEYTHFEHPTYPQLNGEFAANLSIVDYLFNVSRPRVGSCQTLATA